MVARGSRMTEHYQMNLGDMGAMDFVNEMNSRTCHTLYIRHGTYALSHAAS